MPELRWRRLLALAVDYLVILGWFAVVAGAAALIFLLRGGVPDLLGAVGPLGAQAVGFALTTLPVGVYLYRSETGRHHATIGKRLFRLWSVRWEDDQPPSRRAVLARTVVKLLPWEFSHTFVWQLQWFFHQHGYAAVPPEWITVGMTVGSVTALIYAGLVFITGRGPHDWAAATIVIARQPPLPGGPPPQA